MASTPSPAPLADADPSDAAFASRLRSALFWRSGSQIVAQLLSWAATLAVIRILDPADYGLFAMTQVVMSLLNFLNGYGLISALVQSDSVSEQRLRQAFGLLLLLNGGLAAAQLVLAPLAAAYYQQPMIADLLRVQALIFLATPFISVPEVLMGRALDFRRPAIVNLVAALAAALVAIGGAVAGLGVWTLVWAPLVGFWVKGAGYVLATGFRLRPSFDFRGTGGMIAFGASLLGGQLCLVIQSQADIFIAGRTLGPHALGLYAEALFLTQIFVSKFIPPLNDVAFPAYARMQKDVSRVAWSFCKALRLLLLIACPLYVGMAVSAAPLVETLFGAKWLGMVPLVEIIALAMPFMTIQVMIPPLCNALGRPGLSARLALAGAVIMPVAFLIGSRFGVVGLAWAWLAGYPLFALIALRVAARLIGLRVADLLRAVLPPVAAAAAMAVPVLLVDQALPTLAAPLRLAGLVATGVTAYGLLLRLLAPATLAELIALVRRRSPAAD
jgi:O-antigen/teichoic acid export membrane protein